MQVDEINKFWRGKQSADDNGHWAHKLDRQTFDDGPHTFNLDYPVSPYVGDVLAAPIIILNANAGYSSEMTPSEFSDDGAVDLWLARVDDPSNAEWSSVSHYYDRTNYGNLVTAKKAVVVNACAYRSPKISDKAENDNRSMIKRLPSSIFTRRWLLEAIIPLAKNGSRLVVVNRGGLWSLGSAANSVGVVRDPCPASRLITGTALIQMTEFLANHP